MSHLTAEQLEKLASLCALEITAEQKEKFHGQLETILAFVSQLDNCVVDDDLDVSHPMQDQWVVNLREGVHTQDDTDALLATVTHPLEQRMIVLRTSTHKGDE